MDQNNQPKNEGQIYTAPANTQATVLNLATPGLRIGAYLLDCLAAFICAIPAYIIYFVVILGAAATSTSTYDYATGTYTSSASPLFGAASIGALLMLAIYGLVLTVVLYFIVPIYVFKGQTIGKKILNLKIVQENGSMAEQQNIVKRYSYLGAYLLISWIPCINYIAALAIFVAQCVNIYLLFTDPKRQTLFDKFAKTVVVQQ